MTGRFVQHQLAREGGRVHWVQDLAHQRPRAWRSLDEEQWPRSSWPEVRSRLKKAARLRHPYLGQLVAVGEQDGQLHVVCEWLDGGSLAEVAGPVPVDVALHWVEGLADALRLAHEAGLCHGGLDPDRVILGEDGVPRLCWLGLWSSDDPIADVCSLGRILDTLLPVPPASVEAIIRRAVTGQVESAAQLRDDLRQARRSLGADHSLDGDAGPGRRRRRWLLLLLLLLLCVVIGLGTLFVRLTTPAPPELPPAPASRVVPAPPPTEVVSSPAPRVAEPAAPLRAPAPPAGVDEVDPPIVIQVARMPPAPSVVVTAIPAPPPPAPPPPAPVVADPVGTADEVPSGWQVSEEPGRKHPTIVLSLDARADVYDRNGTAGRPRLRVECRDRKVHVNLEPAVASVESVLTENSFEPTHAAAHLTLDGASDALDLRLGTRLGFPKDLQWTQSLRGGRELQVSYTPFASSAVVAQFDVAGLDAVLPRFLEFCSL